jgi:hypothetical protein
MDNILKIFDNNNNIVAERNVPIGTALDPVIIQDIQLPAGDYIAELAEPVNAMSGRQSVIVEAFRVERVPIVNVYSVITEKRDNQWVNVVTYNVQGKVIEHITFNDSVNQFEVDDQTFEVVYDFGGSDLNVTFTIGAVQITDNLYFQQIPQSFTVVLPALVARLASRTINGVRELVTNIIYDTNELVLDTRGSISPIQSWIH